MNIDIFWEIISLLKILVKQGTGESIKYGAKEKLMKFSTTDVVIFKIIYDKYYDILSNKYNLDNDEKINNKGIIDFLIAQGYKTYKYYYKLKSSTIKEVKKYMDVIYSNNVYKNENLNNNASWHGFTDIEFLINETYLEKTEKTENDIEQLVLMHVYMLPDEIEILYNEIENSLK